MKSILLLLFAIILVGCENLISAHKDPAPVFETIEAGKVENIHIDLGLTAYHTLSHVLRSNHSIPLLPSKSYRITVDYSFKVDGNSDVFKILEMNHCLHSVPNFSILNAKATKVLAANLQPFHAWPLPDKKRYILRAEVSVSKASKFEMSLVSWIGSKKEKPILASVCDSRLSDEIIVVNNIKQFVYIDKQTSYLDPNQKIICDRELRSDINDMNCNRIKPFTSQSTHCTYDTANDRYESTIMLNNNLGSITCKKNGEVFEELSLSSCQEKILDHSLLQ